MLREETAARTLPHVAANALVVSIVVAGVALGCFVIAKAYVVALVFFSAVILAETARPFVDRLSKRLNRPLSIVLTLVMFSAIGAGAVVIPTRILWPQLVSFARSLSVYASAVAALAETWLGGSVREQFLRAVAGNAVTLGSGLIEAQRSIAAAVSIVVLTLLVAAFWLSSSDSLRASALVFVPANLRSRADELFREMGATLGVYAGGVVVNGSLVALGSTIVLWLLHTPYPFVLGLLQGALVAVPYLGTLVAVVTAGGVVLAGQGWKAAAEAVALLSLMEGFEGSFIAPLVFKKQLNLDPLATVLATGIGGAVLGVAGVVLAIPATALLQTVIGRAVLPALRNADGNRLPGTL